MYGENATVGSSLGTAAEPARPLESISLAANRINTANVLIAQFIDRFHGDSPAQGENIKEPPETAGRTPYSHDLSRLFEALDRLETRVEALNSIG